MPPNLNRHPQRNLLSGSSSSGAMVTVPRAVASSADRLGVAAYELKSSQPQAPLSAEIPLDPAITAPDAGDMPADLLVEHRLPGHELEA